MQRVTGVVQQVLAFCDPRDGVRLMFQKRSKELMELKDVGRMLCSYACIVQHTLDYDVETGEILNVVTAARLDRTFPLKYCRMRRALNQTKFGVQALTREFKGRGKDEYINDTELVQHVRNRSIMKCLLGLFDRAFQPESYYFVACYLRGPQLLEKTEEELKQLSNCLIYSPSMCCFLSNYVTDTAAADVEDLRYADAVRLARNFDKDQDVVESEAFAAAVSLYQQLLSEKKRFGASVHTVAEDGEAVQYLCEQRLLVKLPGQRNKYMLGAIAEYGDGAVAEAVSQILERVPMDERSRTAVDEFSYEPDSMPLLLIRSCGTNHHALLRRLMKSWQDVEDRLCKDVVLVCENVYASSSKLVQDTDTAVHVYREGSPPVLGDRVGLLIIEAVHLWDSVLLGRLLLSLKSRWDSLHFIIAGDDREMPVYAGRGAGSLFSDLYRSKLLPVVYVTDPLPAPAAVPSTAMELLLKGNRSRSFERSYGCFNRMTYSQFMSQTQQQQLQYEIAGSARKAVRIVCGSRERRLELYNMLRLNVWKPGTEYRCNIYNVNEAVYSSKLKQSLFAEAVIMAVQTQNRSGVCSVSYKRCREKFPCVSSPTNVTKKLVLQDRATGLEFLTPIRYEEGLHPATVHLYSQSQAYNSNDITYLVIDRDTPWRVLYTAAVKTTQKLCLVYPDDSVFDELLDHIVDTNWAGYGRRGALLFLLRDQSTAPPVKKQRRNTVDVDDDELLQLVVA